MLWQNTGPIKDALALPAQLLTLLEALFHRKLKVESFNPLMMFLKTRIAYQIQPSIPFSSARSQIKTILKIKRRKCWIKMWQSHFCGYKLIEISRRRSLWSIASDAWLSRPGGEKGRLEYPMERGLDTDWAEASDSREEELSRLRRLGSSVESEQRKEILDENNRIVWPKLQQIKFEIITMSGQVTEQIIRTCVTQWTLAYGYIYQTVPAETGEQSARCGGWLSCLSSAPLLLGQPHISQILEYKSATVVTCTITNL